jgi:hypothetical protein
VVRKFNDRLLKSKMMELDWFSQLLNLPS